MRDVEKGAAGWNWEGPIGPQREIRGRDVIIGVLPAVRVLHLEGARHETQQLLRVLTSLGATGLPVPGRSVGDGRRQLLAITDDTYFLIDDAGEVAIADVSDAFHVALDASDAWTSLFLTGREATALLAKGCALDFHSSVFPPGACAAAGFAQIRAVIWRPGDDLMYGLMIGRSYALSFWHWLLEAADDYGCTDNHQLTHEARQ